jgi:hypothetical protein
MKHGYFHLRLEASPSCASQRQTVLSPGIEYHANRRKSSLGLFYRISHEMTKENLKKKVKIASPRTGLKFGDSGMRVTRERAIT